MEFGLSTPALLFSAISLLMLAYTNRFLAIANLVRQAVKSYEADPTDNTRRQIRHFKVRLWLIQYTQVFGVLSFILCVVCMMLVMLARAGAAELLFSGALVSMALSLVLSLVEVLISIAGLKLELRKVGA
ncbi:MAG: DUF2721 domain-containing protein [Methanothrix sp.]|nr:DUF2721 domain-containing protein [Methanothrix sp.]